MICKDKLFMGKKFFLLLFFLSGVAAWCGSAVNESEMNSVLASVNGEAISLKDVLTLTRQQEYLAYAAFSGDKLTAEIKRIRKKAVDELIDRKLLVAEYHKQSFRISGRDIEHEIDQTALRMGCRSRGEFRAKMAAENVDYELFRKELESRMIHIYMLQRLSAIEGTPTPKEVYEYFQAHKDELAVRESYELAMLKLDKNKAGFDAEASRISGILDNAPERFPELAVEFNSLGKDGRIGAVEPGKIRVEFAAVLKEPVEGKIYGPVTLDDGVAWIKLLKHNKAVDADFAGMQEKIMKILEKEKRDKALAVYIADLRQNAVLEYFF